MSPARLSRKAQRNRLIVFNVVLWGLILFVIFPAIGLHIGIPSGIGGPAAPAATAVPWSQLSPGDQFRRYNQCALDVVTAQLAGKFPAETDADGWCLTHQKDDPASWPTP